MWAGRTLRTCLLSDLGLRDVDHVHDNTTLEHLRHASLPGKPRRGALEPQIVTMWFTVPVPTFTANVPVLDSVDMMCS